MGNHKHQLSKRKSLINGFIPASIDLTLSHFQYLHQQCMFLTHRMKTQHPTFHIQDLLLVVFRARYHPLHAEVTFRLCYRVINGNKETAEMTGMQTGTPALVHV